MPQFAFVTLQCITWRGVMGNPPRVTLNGSQSARDQWPPIPLLHCTALLLLRSTVYLNTCRHPRGGEIAPDPPPPKLIPSLAAERERGGKLFNEDGSRWWLYISFLNSGHTALLQPILTFVLPPLRRSAREVQGSNFRFCFRAALAVSLCVCVCVCADCKNQASL